MAEDRPAGGPDVDTWFDQIRRSARAVEHLLFGYVVVDPRTGRLVSANPRAVDIFGGELPGSVPEALESGLVSRADHDELLRQAGQGGGHWRSEITLHRPDGRFDLVVMAATVDHPDLAVEVVAAVLAERGSERIVVDAPFPDRAPLQMQFTYDRHLVSTTVDPRLTAWIDDPTINLGVLMWATFHPRDLPLALPWLNRLQRGEDDEVEFTVRIPTHVGNWTPAHFEVRRLLGSGEAQFTATMTLVGEFRDTIAPGQLTPRELAVVAALFDGHRVPRIAERDGVSVKTLRNQLSAVFRKLGVANQEELLATFHRPRVEPPPARAEDLTRWWADPRR
jgi:DNA-binding CsgD family transcriptional regulator